MTEPEGAPLRALIIVGFGVMAVSAVSHFRAPLLPSIGRDLSMSAAELGVVTTAFAVGRLATDIPAGRLADRWSAGGMLSVAATVLAAASLVFAAAGTQTVVFLAAGVLGVASAMANTTGVTYFSESTSAARRGRALAAFSAALLGGQAFGPTVGGLLTSLGTWRTAQVWGAVIAGVTVVVMALGARATPPKAAREEGTPAAEESTSAPSVAVPLHERVILYSVPFVMFFTLGAMPQTLVPIIGASSLGLSAATIGLALGLGGGCRLVGAIIGGVVSDRVSRKAALVPGLTFQAVGVGLLMVRGSTPVWVAAIAVMSLASFSISVAATMLADRFSGRRVGRQLGPFRFVGDVGLIVGPAAAAAIFEHVGQRTAVLMVVALLSACAFASAVGLRETRWLSAGQPASTPGH